MRVTVVVILSLMLACTAIPAEAGQGCSDKRLTSTELALAADTAVRALTALESGPSSVALISRQGTDLSNYGLHYSHVAFAVRDHPDGHWRVVHLLNDCGTDESHLYAQGLVNYFAANLTSQDARIDWLRDDVAVNVESMLLDDPSALHESRYNMLAPFDSDDSQNSTAWVLEVLSWARHRDAGHMSRADAQRFADRDAHAPDVIRVPYGKRVLGGLFSANVDFTDHPVGTRLSGRYPVVTVRSILRYAQQNGVIVRTQEYRDGRETVAADP